MPVSKKRKKKKRIKPRLNPDSSKRTPTVEIDDPIELPPSGYSDPRVAWMLQTLEPGTRVFLMGQCSIFLSLTEKYGYHLSIAHPKRYPTWAEIAHARYKLIPNECNMALLLPSEEDYINAYEPVFQMTEVFQDRATSRIYSARWVRLEKFEPGQPFETKKSGRRCIKLAEPRQDTPGRIVCVDCATGDFIHFGEGEVWVKPLKV